jgi:heat shock protein HtpX
MLVEPLFGKEGKRSWWARMMDDHPPLDERIKNLELVLGEQGGTDEYDLN